MTRTEPVTNRVLELYFTKITNEVKRANPRLTDAQVFTQALNKLPPGLRRELVEDRRKSNR